MYPLNALLLHQLRQGALFDERAHDRVENRFSLLLLLSPRPSSFLTCLSVYLPDSYFNLPLFLFSFYNKNITSSPLTFSPISLSHLRRRLLRKYHTAGV